MIVKEYITLGGIDYVKRYSDQRFYIDRLEDGRRFEEVLDKKENEDLFHYVESDVKVPDDPPYDLC